MAQKPTFIFKVGQLVKLSRQATKKTADHKQRFSQFPKYTLNYQKQNLYGMVLYVDKRPVVKSCDKDKNPHSSDTELGNDILMTHTQIIGVRWMGIGSGHTTEEFSKSLKIVSDTPR